MLRFLFFTHFLFMKAMPTSVVDVLAYAVLYAGVSTA